MNKTNTNDSNNEPRVQHHISQFFSMPKGAALDFFDANLVFDSRAFIDPFLLKNSSVAEEVQLFDRFGDYFRFAYDESLKLSLNQISEKDFRRILTVKEPKNINMGYTANSNDGRGPSLTDRLLDFFMDNAAKRFVAESDAFPEAKYNPVSIEVFTTGIGPDGISDITANLIMDYLISYTQKQAVIWGIPLKSDMRLDRDGFDFEEMEWRGGGYYELPENPYHPGQALILVPRRLLRGLDDIHDNAVGKVMRILRSDDSLSQKFSKLVHKRISDVSIEDIRRVFKAEKSVHRRYLKLLEAERSKPYDFRNDPLGILADKTYEDCFKAISLPKIESGQDLVRLVDILVGEFQKEFAGRDGWRDAWKVTNSGSMTPQIETAIGRKFRAMGFALFSLFPEVTFTPEAGTGNGSVDFQIVYKDYRIAIELKLLKNGATKGDDDPMPAYLRGLKRQLPHYVELIKANRAYYITGQHYNGKATKKSHGHRAQEIRLELPAIEEELKQKLKNFDSLTYINVDMSQRPSASKL